MSGWNQSVYYGPDEPESTIEYERYFVAGDVVVGAGYGIQFMLWFNCARFLWGRRKFGRQAMFLLVYMTTMLLIESLFVAVQARTVQMIYIDNRNFPGGPWTFFLASQSAAVNVIFYATLFLLTFLSDLLVLWRCWVIWSASGHTGLAWAVTAFPAILLVGSFVVGTLWTIESSKPSLSLYSPLPVQYGTSYYAISLSSNIILTLLITGRLIVYRRTLAKTLPAELARHYISLATVVVESAALYSVTALLFLITYAVNNPSGQIWLGVASACQQISNLLIIYRLAEGSAWQKDTLSGRTASAPIHFGNGPPGHNMSTNVGSFHLEAPLAESGSSDEGAGFKEARSDTGTKEARSDTET
ncbi:hypothetical protein C8R46DRAFT_1056057, partial [Mycena filopes]